MYLSSASMMRLAFGPGSLVFSFGPAGLEVTVLAMLDSPENVWAPACRRDKRWTDVPQKCSRTLPGRKARGLVAGEEIRARLRRQRVHGAARPSVHQVTRRRGVDGSHG